MPDVILHVVVAGFHHKRGCQIDYIYPPIGNTTNDTVTPGNEIVLPDEWRHLPSFMLPDGAHNVDSDNICFTLPSLPGSSYGTVFGTACYRMIAASELPKDDQVTRTFVQKSVCVLTSKTIFDALAARLDLITQVYFNERNFTNTKLLRDMYLQLCATFNCDDGASENRLSISDSAQLSSRILLKVLGRDVLLMFKLLLLERRVLICVSTSGLLSRIILALLSLYPKMIDVGLQECASTRNCEEAMKPSRNISTAMKRGKSISNDNKKIELNEPSFTEKIGFWWQQSRDATSRLVQSMSDQDVADANDLKNQPLEMSVQDADEPPVTQILTEPATRLTFDELGMPFAIFEEGNVCLPYTCLSMLDSVSKYRACLIGATNMLFRLRKNFFDVMLFINEDGIMQTEIIDPDLKSELALTNADLRFVDYILRKIGDRSGTNVLDTYAAEESKGVHGDWEGGDEWCRLQFKSYLLSLCASSSENIPTTVVDFNPDFVKAWKNTRNYSLWQAKSSDDALKSIVPGHPFAGQLSFADIKMRFDSFLATPGGRKLNANIDQTSKNFIANARKAKNVLSTFFSSVPDAHEEAHEATNFDEL